MLQSDKITKEEAEQILGFLNTKWQPGAEMTRSEWAQADACMARIAAAFRELLSDELNEEVEPLKAVEPDD